MKRILAKLKNIYYIALLLFFIGTGSAVNGLPPNALCNDEQGKAIQIGVNCNKDDTEAPTISEEANLFNYFDKFVDLMVLLFSPLALGMMIYSATLYITANGNDEQIRNAKSFFLFGIIGTAVVVFAFVLIRMTVEITTKLA